MIDTVIHSDCLAALRAMPDNSVDAVVTDPPYGLSKQPNIREVLQHWLNGDKYEHKNSGFMGKSWDSFVPGPEYWQEIFRVMKPGAHLLAFGGTRTYDLLAIAIRFAGFECRDMLMWIHGQGFPKSLNLGNGKGRDEVHWIDRHDGKGKVPVNARIQPAANHHPTVKSTSLMRWLVRLITPPGGIVLDPFCGSGSTCVACVYEGVHFIGIEQDESYVNIARARIAHAMQERKPFPPEAFGSPTFQEQAQEYDCDESCPIRILGEQSGERKSGGREPSGRIAATTPARLFNSTQITGSMEPSTGTAARYFQHFPPDSLFAECEEEASA